MNDEVIEDLKQFISTTVGQTEARLKEDIKGLRQEMRDGFAGVGDTAETSNDQVDERLDKVESRLDALEQAA